MDPCAEADINWDDLDALTNIPDNDLHQDKLWFENSGTIVYLDEVDARRASEILHTIWNSYVDRQRVGKTPLVLRLRRIVQAADQ